MIAIRGMADNIRRARETVKFNMTAYVELNRPPRRNQATPAHRGVVDSGYGGDDNAQPSPIRQVFR